MDPATLATIAASAATLLHRKKKGPDRNAILSRYRASRPVGYTTPEDQAMAERARTTLAGAAQSVAQQRRAQNARSVTARGLSGPAAAALENDATAVAAQGSENAARTSADLLYRAYNSNLGYERQKNDTAFGSEMGIASQEAAQNQASEADFWNSALTVIPGIAQAWSKPAGAASVAPVAAPSAGAVRSPVSTYSAAPVTPAQRSVRGNAVPVYR